MGSVNSNEDGTRFQALVMPYLADAYALASWLAGNRTDAEDIVQEACLRAFQGFGAFANGSPRAWLLTIVRNTAYSWLGKNRSLHPRRAACFCSTDTRSSTSRRSGSVTPETELIAKADAAQLEAAIAELPVSFRETLVLRDLHGLDYREIAEVTRVPVGTVMSRLARARQRLVATVAADER